MLVCQKESYAILGACFEVYRDKGCGFLEGVYQECLAIEFEVRGIPFEEQPQIPLEYRGRILEYKMKPDFVCYGNIIVEIKALSQLVDEYRAQVLNYLNATNFPLGLLINFGHHPGLEHERFAHTRQRMPPEGPAETFQQ